MELSEMTLEELWHLFPIRLEPHNPAWAEWFEEEARCLKTILSGRKLQAVTHIGSTAVPGIWAKPIVDILVELEQEEDIREVAGLLTAAGYLSMSEDESRISLNKGYTPAGFADRVFHIHLRYAGDNAEIRFRDILRSDKNLAKEYEQLKLSLWKRFEFDRDGYTAAKTDFITAALEAK